MDEINGVSFENWAAACAHLANGMPEEEVLSILGLEAPVWQQTTDQWANKLGDLMAADMNVATKYGEIFANPKVGKFAEGGSQSTTGIDDLLANIPDWDAYQKIFWDQSVASECGIDPVTALQKYDLNLQQWSQVSMHYSKWYHSYVVNGHPEFGTRANETANIGEKWKNYWKDHYKEHNVDLGGDIDF